MYIVLRRAETGLLAGSPSGVNRALGGRSGKVGRLRRSLWASEFDPKPWLD
jgi:hypothetical protein